MNEPDPRHACPHIKTGTAEFTNRLHEIVDDARVVSPIAWDDAHGRWFVTRYSTATQVLKNWQAFTSAKGVKGLEGSPLMPPIDKDPPEHEDWRGPLQEFFKPRAVARWEEATRRIATQLIDGFAEHGRVEFISEFARPFPGQVFFEEVVDLPLADVEKCQRWAEMVVGASEEGDAFEGFRGLMDYASGLVATLRSASEHDAVPTKSSVVQTVVQTRVGGELVSEVEAARCLTMLLLAGLETTTNTLGSSMLHLARHPDHWALLRERVDLVPQAVEEFLRLYAPTINLCRVATEEVEVDGVAIHAGEQVGVSYLSANHDPREFSDPHRFRLDRENTHHLAFGHGRHFCLGAHLARLMLKTALEELFARFNSIDLAEGYEPRYLPSSVHTLADLSVTLTTR